MDSELDKTIHYYSQHITAKLQEMLRARTTVAEAPLGYGKITAARDYLDNHLPTVYPFIGLPGSRAALLYKGFPRHWL